MNIEQTALEFKLTASEYMILQYIKRNPEFSASEASYDINLTPRTISEKVRMLEKLEVIERDVTSGKGTKYKILPCEGWILQ